MLLFMSLATQISEHVDAGTDRFVVAVTDAKRSFLKHWSTRSAFPGRVDQRGNHWEDPFVLEQPLLMP